MKEPTSSAVLVGQLSSWTITLFKPPEWIRSDIRRDNFVHWRWPLWQLWGQQHMPVPGAAPAGQEQLLQSRQLLVAERGHLPVAKPTQAVPEGPSRTSEGRRRHRPPPILTSHPFGLCSPWCFLAPRPAKGLAGFFLCRSSPCRPRTAADITVRGSLSTIHHPPGRDGGSCSASGRVRVGACRESLMQYFIRPRFHLASFWRRAALSARQFCIANSLVLFMLKLGAEEAKQFFEKNYQHLEEEAERVNGLN